jgi:PEGA domain
MHGVGGTLGPCVCGRLGVQWGCVRGEESSGVIVRRTRNRAAAWVTAGALGVSVCVSAPAWAQGKGTAAAGAAPKAAAAEPSAAEKEAIQHFEKGREAANADQWDKAREEFLTAFKLSPQPRFIGVLITSEIAIGRYRDAAEHLTLLLREGQGMSASDRQAAEQKLAEVKQKIGVVTIEVRTAGADVLVDGQKVGTSPLPEPVFVEAGRRRFEARKEGAGEGSQQVEVAGGTTPTVVLKLEPVKKGPGPEVPPEPAPKWRTGVIVGGAALGAVGIGVGVGFSVAAGIKNGEVMDEVQHLKARTPSTQVICPQGAGEPRCAKLVGLLEPRDTYSNVAIAGFVVGGVAAAGTLVVALLKPDRPTQKGQAAPRSLVILPVPGGAVVSGTF